MSRRMDTTDDFPLRSTHNALSSTSGDGETQNEAMFTLNTRRKVRRKTVTTNDSSRLNRAQSVSGSAFGSPSSGIQPLPPIQPSEALGSPSTGYLDHGSLIIASSPHRTNTRTTTNASSKVAHFQAAPLGSRSGVGRGKGLSRTLTLPTQLSDTLERMRISTEDVSTLSLPSTKSPSRQSLHTEESGVGMDIDEGDGGGSVATRFEKKSLAKSRRQPTRRRAHSLPPAKTEDVSDCDADDEGGVFGVAEDEDDAVLVGPVVPITRQPSRARQSSPDIELPSEGASKPSSTAVRKAPIPLRRSARRKTLGATDGAQVVVPISPLLLTSAPNSSTARKRSRGRDSMPPPESTARTKKRTRKE